MSEIIETIDEKKNKNEKQRQKKNKNSPERYSQRVRAKWFCCALRLAFFQSICKVS